MMHPLNTLIDWLTWLETQHPSVINLGLERVQPIAEKLGLQKWNIPVITIAGTNGKGSCVATLEHIYIAAGYQVGAYVSPHLLHFNERVRIQNHPVHDDLFITAFQSIRAASENIALTYFEFITLAALWIFKQQPLEVLILEVGMGGRLDAVNLVDPAIAVITTIDLDHQLWLGPDREAIGYEKAGIFRSGIPAICGDPDPPRSVIAQAEALGIAIWVQAKNFTYSLEREGWRWQCDEKVYEHLPLPRVLLQNASTALAAITALEPRLPVTEAAIKDGLKTVYVTGRLQSLIFQRIQHILDVSHNPQSCQALAHFLAEQPTTGKTVAVFSMLADKDITISVAALAPYIDYWYIAPLEAARASSVTQLRQALDELTITRYDSHASVVKAWRQALGEAEMGDRIVVCGSFYTVSAILDQISHESVV